MKRTIGIALLSLLLCARAQAQDDHAVARGHIGVGEAVVCETQEQVEHYIAHYDGDQDAAVRAVNREAKNSRACDVVSAAFVPGPEVATVSRGNMAFRIVRILVLAVDSEDGFREVEPALYFTVFGVPEYPA
jgi:hypothetical protein